MQRPALVDQLLSMPRSLRFVDPRRSIVADVACALNEPADPEAAATTLSRLGLHDEDLTSFYRCCDGGTLVGLRARDPAGQGVFVPSLRLYPAQDLEIQTDCFRAWFEFVPEDVRPPSCAGVAIGEATETGNFFVALPDGSSIAVYYFDHDDPTQNSTPLAWSFRDFISLLATPPYTPIALISGYESVLAES